MQPFQEGAGPVRGDRTGWFRWGVLRWERNQFQARGLSGSWLKVRLASIPAALLAAILVAVVPARNTSGMEGLAVFYILLLVASPLLWFGMHWAVGQTGETTALVRGFGAHRGFAAGVRADRRWGCANPAVHRLVSDESVSFAFAAGGSGP